MNTQKNITMTKETIFRLLVPLDLALDLNRLLISSKENKLGEKWERYNLNVFITGFVNLEGGKVFQQECYSTNNLPLGMVKDFIVQISSFDEKTNPEILHGFTKQLSETFFKELVS